MVERGAVDSFKVAAWAKMFQPGDLPDAVKGTLGEFAKLLKGMATMPAGAGRG